MGTHETAAAFRELVNEIADLDKRFLEGPSAVTDDASKLEGYKWIFSILQVAFDAYIWADSARPRFVEIVGPYKKWGGDNPDAAYRYAPIDPTRTYRVTGRRRDAVYLSLTVYGGPDDGRYSERIIGALNDRDLTFDSEGRFELVLSPDPHDGAWIQLDPDAVCVITRDYLVHPATQEWSEWSIESADPPATKHEDDTDLARRFRAALTWVREQAKIVPISGGEPNTVDDPYPVPKETFGWAAGDAAYAMGRYELGPDDALELRGRSPECAFWNLCLWNPFLHTYNYDYERVAINGGEMTYEDDGSWVIVVSAADPGHPNWVSTAGHTKGLIWFRWFLPAETPSPISARVVRPA